MRQEPCLDCGEPIPWDPEGFGVCTGCFLAEQDDLTGHRDGFDDEYSAESAIRADVGFCLELGLKAVSS